MGKIDSFLMFYHFTNIDSFRSQANRTESPKPRIQLLCGFYQRYDKDF